MSKINKLLDEAQKKWEWLSESERFNQIKFWATHKFEDRPQIGPEDKLVRTLKGLIDLHAEIRQLIKNSKGIHSEQPLFISDANTAIYNLIGKEIDVLNKSYEKITDQDSVYYGFDDEVLDTATLERNAARLKKYRTEKKEAQNLMMAALRQSLIVDSDDIQGESLAEYLADVHAFLEKLAFVPDQWLRRNNMLMPFRVQPIDRHDGRTNTIENLKHLFAEYNRAFVFGLYRSCSALARAIIECCVAGNFPDALKRHKDSGHIVWANTFSALEKNPKTSDLSRRFRKYWEERSGFVHWNENVTSTKQDTAYADLHENLRILVCKAFSLSNGEIR